MSAPAGLEPPQGLEMRENLLKKYEENRHLRFFLWSQFFLMNDKFLAKKKAIEILKVQQG